ncbi:nuclear transport factor 2 family protein [Chryseobacterium sp. CT-SW4]|uniref:nuclear transport factor 2 family protein n=1 Tax=Chryseobacterium sp. SW-1 TaxID=3157343 RepID=UPI003B01F200
MKLIGYIALGALLWSCSPKEKKETDNTRAAAVIEQNEKNKKLVLDFYQSTFGDKNFDKIDQYLAPEYIQHNPKVADGAEAFKKGVQEWLKDAPKTKIDVQHVAAEGDLVFVHLKNKRPDGGLKSTIDIFRVKDNKIVEHWDVHQDVPEKSANPHPMF